VRSLLWVTDAADSSPGTATALDRSALLCNSIADELECNAVLDGEIVVLAEDVRSHFNELLFRRGEPRFFAFDLLWCDGQDLRFYGLVDRKRKLRSLITARERLLFCDHIEEHCECLFDFACENDLEGRVAKPRNGPYPFTDSETSWLKIKNPDYTQTMGRDELFSRSDAAEPAEIDGWAGCSLACAVAGS
jgi:ATP-dependent DNA ligase